ncbi:MAG: N-acetyl-gamma-glutamyl-phosphate reductase [Limnochordaceae bacterium]|nr:N-acetyl-gamma-glutamyl-phosphate reductase [Limnochordaceae bacterium]
MRVAVIGASGYSGAELTALLLAHPAVDELHLVSRTYAGQPLAAVLPHLRQPLARVAKPWAQDLHFEALSPEAVASQSDCVFCATPAGAARPLARAAWEAGIRLVDLGADFRLHDATLYPKFYSFAHDEQTLPLLSVAVYGLSEWYRAAIEVARLVANPGCYPTATLLSTLPLARAGLLGEGTVSVVGLSGVSGAGATPAAGYHFPEMTENTRPYNVLRHRHTPEMEQELSQVAGHPVAVAFVPQLVPMSRGILTTSFLPLARSATTAELLSIYRETYQDSPFIRVLGEEYLPQTKAVQGSNYCDLTVRATADGRQAVAWAALDNLRKGAAGQAVQNMNLMFGLPETTGLEAVPLWP